MAFLEIITRAYKRPVMLDRNRESLRQQTDNDWKQTILRDDDGIGVSMANAQLAHIGGMLTGDYIWILDDDDLCIQDSFVSELKRIVSDRNPDVIMVKMDHDTRGILPDLATWGIRPKIAKVGVSSFVIRRDVWKQNSHAWLTACYSSDYDFISAVFDSGVSVFWYDVIASQVQQISLGATE